MADPRFGSMSTVTAPTLESASPYDYEWLAPNSQHGRYFTTTQARMYIGNLFIDELNTVQFAYQGNRIPVYGYCSENFDAIGSGKRLVQGQILINFISEGYLYTVLNEYERLTREKGLGKMTQPDTDNELAQQIASLGLQRSNFADIIKRGASATTPESLVQDAMSAVADLDDEIARLASRSPDAVDKARQVMANRDRLRTSVNAIASKVPFDIVMELFGGGRTVTRTLRSCVLTSNEQVYDQSGVTLVDAYGFIARSLE